MTSDSGILGVLESATGASLDAADPPDSLYNQAGDIVTGKSDLDFSLPWWIYAGAGVGILALLRR